MTAARVTAVIPTTGRAELTQAVRSVVEQSTETRVIVVEADPRQHTVISELLAPFGGDVTLIAPGRRLTASAARNLGTDEVRTHFVAYLDDDDVWLPEKVAAQLDAIDAAGLGDVVCSTSSFFGRDLEIADGDDGGPVGGRVVPVVPYATGRMADYLLVRPRLRYGYHFLQSSSLLVTTELARSSRWNEQLVKHEDWDLLIRLIDLQGVDYLHVPNPLTVVRQGSSDSASQRSTPDDSLRWIEGIECSSRARNDFILAIVIRPALAARDAVAVRAGVRAMSITGRMSPAALVGVAAGLRARGTGVR